MKKILANKVVLFAATAFAAVLVAISSPDRAEAAAVDTTGTVVTGTTENLTGSIIGDVTNPTESNSKVPVITNVTQGEWGVRVEWKKAAKAKGYSVFRKKAGDSSGKWKCIAKHVTSKAIIDKTVTSGTEYVYKVRAYFVKYEKANANRYLSAYWSDMSAASDAGFWLQKPNSISVKKTSSGVKVTWSSVKGATSYVVCRKTPGSSKWEELATTKSRSYTDKKAESGVTYAYGVKSKKKDVTSKVKYTSYNAKYSGEELRLYKEIVGCTSKTPYCIAIDRRYNYLGVFKKAKGDWELIKYWRCSTGKIETYTPGGTFSIYKKSKVFTSHPSSYYCYWYSAFNEKNGIHSVTFKPKSLTVKNGKLGAHISNGCVRVAYDNAKWVYDNCAKGTTVRVFGSLDWDD